VFNLDIGFECWILDIQVSARRICNLEPLTLDQDFFNLDILTFLTITSNTFSHNQVKMIIGPTNALLRASHFL